MNLDSFASVVIWLVIALIILGIQPWKTFAAMGRAVEHNADRYSTSMRIINVDELGYMAACDDGRKGIAMLSGAGTSILDDVYVARIRAQRKEAIRRRRILVVSLLVLTVLVLVFAGVLHFSAWLALIPAALEVLVLYLGVRAGKAQRAWEARVAASRRQWRDQAARKSAHITTALPTEAATESLSQEDIAATISRAREERKSALRARSAMAAADRIQRGNSAASTPALAPTSAAAAQSESVVDMDAAIADHHVMYVREGSAQSDTAQTNSAQSNATQSDAAQSNTVQSDTVQSDTVQSDTVQSDTAQSQNASLSVVDIEGAVSDATHELAQICPAHALDAFEMAVSQDLISFSLGAPRNIEPVRTEEPQSLPIISTKQVSKAVPAEQGNNADMHSADSMHSADNKHGVESMHGADSANTLHSTEEKAVRAQDAVAVESAQTTETTDTTETAGKSSVDADASVNSDAASVAGGVRDEIDVEVPQATTESLGADVDAVLARRRG